VVAAPVVKVAVPVGTIVEDQLVPVDHSPLVVPFQVASCA
jgi:hypothetical protein